MQINTLDDNGNLSFWLTMENSTACGRHSMMFRRVVYGTDRAEL
jgi:hypothetical protein